MSPLSTTIRNQRVQQISNRSVRGLTTGRTRGFGSVIYVEIEVDGADTKYVPREDLELIEDIPVGIEELLFANKFGTIGDLARVLIYHKIGSNLSNVFYAMQSSRTDFHAYQFKPVYKFIESLDNRILIADEVGLGKTIEAGLIWLEAQARSKAKRLLIVCPSMLREKWKAELRYRFNTRAEIYNAKGFCELLEEFASEGESFQCAAICSLQTIRQDSVITALSGLENTPGRFDLVIVDEAHHMRNRSTKSHGAGRMLSDLTDALVLLTATPIHLGNQDLFQLLSLLDPEQFEQRWQFDQIVQDNEPVVQAQNLLRFYPPRIEEAREQIEGLINNPTFKNDTNVSKVLNKLAALSAKDHKQMVETGLLLEKLNLLSTHISRTRKREVVEWRVIRNSHSLLVNFNEAEAAFYEGVTQCVQDRVERQIGNKVAAFALMMPQRQMASCIPAMVEHYRSSASETMEVDPELIEDLGIELGEDLALPETTFWPELAEIVAEWDPNTPDSKFDVLRDALNVRFEREPEAKVIIFSYFKKTLAYLARRLSEAGFGLVMIHGDVPMAERLDLIENFKSNHTMRILLSSEVGAEGIDLQFCRVMFNYDLPWNPMKVEQRIGRIDRLGQKADTISIVNFSVAGTIEEKILNRLYHRIGIFERSLGDLEPILGEKAQQLEFDLLSRRLTPQQQDQRIELTLLAAENERQLEEQLAEQSTVILGSADYILEQIGVAREVGRRITSDDLRRFIEDYFEQSEYYGASVKWDAPAKGSVTLKLPSQAQTDLHWFCQSQIPRLSTILCSYNGDSAILTYDSELAQESPSRELLTHFHPLVRWVKSKYDENPELLFPVAAVELGTDLLRPGDYLIVIHLWNFDGVKNSKRIEYEIVPINSSEKIERLDAEKLISEILERGRTWEHSGYAIERNELVTAWNRCNELIHGRMEESFAEFSDDNDNLLDRRRRHLEAFSNRKEASILQAIETMTQKNATENQLRGFRTILDNRRRQTAEEYRKLESRSQVSNGFKEVAAFVCRIRD